MSISIDWGTKVISVPKSYTTLIQSTPTEIRELPLNQFRLDLKALEAAAPGMPHLVTHRHNTEVSLGGIVYARTIEIINGYTVTFEDGQYAVNLTGANSNVGDVINVNQVSVRSANAAGLISNAAIEYSSFDGSVHIDVNSSNVGTAFPIGTDQRPVNNLADALLIASTRGLDALKFLSDFTFDSDVSLSNFEIYGTGLQTTDLTFTSGCILANCEFFDCRMTGTITGFIGATRVFLDDLGSTSPIPVSQDVIITDCLVNGTLSLPSLYSGNLKAINCYSNAANTADTPILDLGDCTASVIMRNWAGGIKILNATQGNDISIDIISGDIILDSSCTVADFKLRGVGTLADSTPDTATVSTDGLVSNTILEYSSFNGGVTIDVLSGTGGTTFPVGTPLQPVDNLEDALTIANARGFKTIFINSNFTLSAGDFSSGFTFRGRNKISTTLIIEDAAQVNNCIFEEFTVEGVLDNGNRLDGCLVNTISSFDGFITNSGINEGIYLGGTTQTTMVDCYSNVPGSDTPYINMGSGSALAVRKYDGGIELRGKTGTDAVSIDMAAGQVIVADTNVAGTITLRGRAEITNNAPLTGTYVKDFMAHNSDLAVLQELIELQRPHHTGTGKMIFWDPNTGDDTRSGDAIDRAVATFARAHDLADDNGHDIIVAVPGNTTGTTVVAENIEISKNYTFLRGPGRDFMLTSAGLSANTILITGNGVEVSGMRVQALSSDAPHLSAADMHAIEVHGGDFPYLHNLFIEEYSQAGIHIEDSNYAIVDTVWIRNMLEYGIHMQGDISHATVINCHINDCVGNGVHIDPLSGHEITLGNNKIIDNGFYGVEIGEFAKDVIIKSDNAIANNALGDILDGGIGTVDLTSSGGAGQSDWTTQEKSQIRSALGVNGTKVTATGGQLQDNTVATKVAAENAEEVNLKVK